MRFHTLITFFICSSLFVLTACNKEDKLLEEDIAEIEQYIVDNNLVAQQTTEGVFYIITTEGQGEQPLISDQVTVHYEGLYLDGVKFDSSYDRGEPSTFNLSQVIEGWQLGIPQFSEGGAGTIIIPSSLGYADSPPSGIRNNAILLFNIELISVN